jgi:glyoxylase-like metal-dependent hydrolase (beta-lactamase superfamily II)
MNNQNHITLDRYKISIINFGEFRLDGGSMFGSVPKALWSRLIPADTDNCIPLVCRSLLIEDETRKILVDVGTGDKWTDKLRSIYAINTTNFKDLPFKRDEITDVILTHLHFDHAGGITRYSDNGSGDIELTYPSARIHLQRANWERANKPTAKDRASYLVENIDPLKIKGADLHLIDGVIGEAFEIFPGIKLHRVDGHTPGQQWVEVIGADERIFFPTDLIPTSHHVQLAFHMGYDVCADKLLVEKQAFLERACAPDVKVCFQHDRDVVFGRILPGDGGRFTNLPLGYQTNGQVKD